MCGSNVMRPGMPAARGLLLDDALSGTWAKLPPSGSDWPEVAFWEMRFFAFSSGAAGVGQTSCLFRGRRFKGVIPGSDSLAYGSLSGNAVYCPERLAFRKYDALKDSGAHCFIGSLCLQTQGAMHQAPPSSPACHSARVSRVTSRSNILRGTSDAISVMPDALSFDRARLRRCSEERPSG